MSLMDEDLPLTNQLCKNSLTAFASSIIPGYEFPPHLLELCRYLKDVEQGKCPRLMISCPPRHGKSLLVCQLFSAWYMGKRPKDEVVVATYGHRLTRRFSRSIKGLLMSKRYAEIFPESLLSSGGKDVNEMHNLSGGTLFASSIGGALSGVGADLLIIDDPYKGRAEAESESHVDATNDWYASVAFTRLSPGGSIVLVGTRWTERDLHAFAEEHQPGVWTRVNFPALSDRGDALWPERFSKNRLIEIRQVLGEYDFEALYQGRPAPRKGGLIRVDKIARPTSVPRCTRRVVSIDGAWGGEKGDWSVMSEWGFAEGMLVMLDLWREKVGFRELKQAALQWWQQKNPECILIENHASGIALLQELRREKRVNVRPVNPTTDKLNRARPFAAAVECDRIAIPANAPWAHEALHEFRCFPSGRHDDIVDSTTQAYDYLQRSALPTPDRHNTRPHEPRYYDD